MADIKLTLTLDTPGGPVQVVAAMDETAWNSPGRGRMTSLDIITRGAVADLMAAAEALPAPELP